MKIDHKDSYQDFGEQFMIDNQIDGYWGSKILLKDIVSPFDLNLIKNKKVMEVGVGCGRITSNLITFQPEKVIGIEPSKAINIAKENINSNKVDLLNIKGEEINFENEFDYVFSLGVIHHIPNYEKVLNKIMMSLKPNGKFIIWVYAKEGNELYLLIFNNLRRITIILPDVILRLISKILAVLTYFYGFLCKFFPLPLKNYFNGLFSKLSFKHRAYTIFDKLNASYAKYFKKMEFKKLLEKSGFRVEKLEHRLGYSYTAICKKIGKV
tara:strand:- start:161 stop:961 length:801 start_codon:yes stop_codon:yes gene_type:complete